LLRQRSIQTFIATAAYGQHKDEHFPKADNKTIRENPAFLLKDAKTRAIYEQAYEASGALYYRGKPTFGEILATLEVWKELL
jgi:acetyl/propionyl-CoA carboxylase alpha subunit